MSWTWREILGVTPVFMSMFAIVFFIGALEFENRKFDREMRERKAAAEKKEAMA